MTTGRRWSTLVVLLLATIISESNSKTLNSEVPVRYDGAQLWRVHNISENHESLADILEFEYDGNVWKKSAQHADIAFKKENIEAAKRYLQERNLTIEILNANIQDLIDKEQTESEDSTKRRKRATSVNFESGMHWEDYQDLDVIYNFMDDIHRMYPNITTVFTIGKTFEGRDLKVMRISNEDGDGKRMWIDGGIHAREWISPATVTYLIYTLTSMWNEGGNKNDITYYIMPVMNPDGYVYSRKVDRFWRKNRYPAKTYPNCIGVDLNRNFDIAWRGPGASDHPCSDIYRGTSPASEFETQAVASFLNEIKDNLNAYITMHSYGQMIAYPWAYKREILEDNNDLKQVADHVANVIKKWKNTDFRTGVTYHILGVAGGGSDDWSRAALGVKYVYTIELRDRGAYGFDLPRNQIIDAAGEGTLAVMIISEKVSKL